MRIAPSRSSSPRAAATLPDLVRWLPIAALTCLSVIACSSDSPLAPQRGSRATVLKMDVTPAAVVPLFTQLSSSLTSYHIHAPQSFFAMDFAVPAGGAWLVSEVVLSGSAPNVPLIHFSFRADHAGQPGATVASYALAPSSATPNACGCGYVDNVFSLPTAANLPPGTYWLVIDSSPEVSNEQVMDFQDADQQLNPALSSTDGGATWLPFQINVPRTDLAFALSGTIETPVDATVDLQTTLTGLGLPNGTLNSLSVKLDAALQALARGDTAAACSALRDFINETSAQSGKKITTANATNLINEANEIRAVIGC